MTDQLMKGVCRVGHDENASAPRKLGKPPVIGWLLLIHFLSYTNYVLSQYSDSDFFTFSLI